MGPEGCQAPLGGFQLLDEARLGVDVLAQGRQLGGQDTLAYGKVDRKELLKKV